jgi:C4-dicarboxylate transporter, DctQ subunit
MRFWDQLDRIVGRVEQALILIFLSLMILTACFQIALRNFLGIGLAWSEPLVRYLVLWVGFIGAALAVREGRHITIEVAFFWISAASAKSLKIISHACSALVCFLLTYAAAKFVHSEAQLENLTFLDLPTWVPELIIPCTFAVMALRFLGQCVKALRRPADSGVPTASI